MFKRRPDAEGDTLDADRIEADWEHALDAATEAVDASSRSGSLSPSEVAAEAEHIRGERRWLKGFGPSLRKLFPRRRRAEESAGPS
jgi:hypothetical protein